jgi:hypothetical protein
MSIHEVMDIVDGLPCFEEPLQDILKTCKRGGAIKIMTPVEYHTDQQRKWYRGVCLKYLSEWNGDTVDEWDMRLKAMCGGDSLLKKELIYLGPGSFCQRLTIKGVGKKRFTQFIENILSKAIEMEWPVDPPDPKLRS